MKRRKTLLRWIMAEVCAVFLCACGGAAESAVERTIPVVSPAVGVWEGQYTKFVGDSDDYRNTEEVFSLELSEDGTGIHHRDEMDFKVTWELDGDAFSMEETFIGDPIRYTGTLSGDDLNIFNGDPEDIWSCEYVYVRKGGTSARTDLLPDKKTEEAASGESEADNSEEGEESAEHSAGIGEMPSGDGLAPRDRVLKGYLWLHDFKSDPFGTTYEEVRDFFGTDGEADKEWFDDHMQMNMRTYFWRSEEDESVYLFVNFQEKDADNAEGVYTVSAYNSNGFTGSMATEEYGDEFAAELREKDIETAADTAMKDFSVHIAMWGDDSDYITFSMQIPERGWSWDERKEKLVHADDPDRYGADFIAFEIDDSVTDFDFYKDSFENYQDLEDREIGGITFSSRSYTNIGYDYIEFIAQYDTDHAISIGVVGVDVSEGTIGDRILDSLTFE